MINDMATRLGVRNEGREIRKETDPFGLIRLLSKFFVGRFPEFGHLAEFFGESCGEVVLFAPVVCEIVESPNSIASVAAEVLCRQYRLEVAAPNRLIPAVVEVEKIARDTLFFAKQNRRE